MVETGATLFPFNRFIRTKPGYFALRYVEPSEQSLSLLRSSLRTDPFAADLTYGLAIHYFALGRHSEANIIFAKLAHLAPNSPQAGRIRESLQ